MPNRSQGRCTGSTRNCWICWYRRRTTWVSTFYVNIPNRGSIHNLPDGAVVEVPARVDAAGLHPFALGDLPDAILPTLAHKVSSLSITIEAAMEGSRRKAVQALINDPYCTDIAAAGRCVNDLIDAELAYLPNFR